jgi:undecaprenyl-diphosphatase
VNRTASRLHAREHAWCVHANRWGARRRVRACLRAASRLGDGALWIAVAAVLLVAGGARGQLALLHMALVGGISALLYRGLKQRLRRPRPFTVDGRIRPWIAPLDEFSFPSGHTLHAVGFGLVACGWFPVLAWVLAPLVLAIAASRVVLGMHYPSDVLAAAGIGLVLAEGTRPLFA